MYKLSRSNVQWAHQFLLITKNNQILSKRDFRRDLERLLIEKSKKAMKPFRVSVEGNIGSGKSTLMRYFTKFPFIKTYDEPLDKWRNLQGHNLLGLLYDDMRKWNSTFQSYVQLTRTQLQSEEPGEHVRVQMFERSVQNNRHCFMENAYRTGLLSPPEYHVLEQWFQWIHNNIDISLDLIVYLRSSPDVVYERIQARQRPEEKGITRQYLQDIHDAHERWLFSSEQLTQVCVIDADSALHHVVNSYESILLPLLTPTALTESVPS